MTDLTADMMSEEDFLEHFGVKGMKWGRRKDGKAGSTHVSADAARYNKLKTRVKKNGTDNLSNDDIAKLNKRSQLMAEYKKNNPTKLEKGREATRSVMKDVKTVATIVGAGAAVAGAISANRNEIRAAANLVVNILKGL